MGQPALSTASQTWYRSAESSLAQGKLPSYEPRFLALSVLYLSELATPGWGFHKASLMLFKNYITNFVLGQLNTQFSPMTRCFKVKGALCWAKRFLGLSGDQIPFASGLIIHTDVTISILKKSLIICIWIYVSKTLGWNYCQFPL